MTLWDRVERWREGIIELKNGVKDSPSYDLKRMINERSEAIAICASELEADLRELREIVEWVPHTEGPGIKQDGHSDECARCALEARIGDAK